MLLEFQILGPLRVRAAEPLPIGGPKPRALLAALLIEHDRTVPRDALIDALWPDDPPPSAVNSVQAYLSKLRSIVGADTIRTSGAGYALVLSPHGLDAERFERLVTSGEDALAEGAPGEAAEILRHALALWRGRVLADLPRYDFAQAEAARLEELRLVARAARVDALLELGESEHAATELLGHVAEHEHELDERFRSRLMVALYRVGRHADALSVYREYRSVVHRELGIEPSKELRALQRAILRRELEPSRRRRTRLARGAPAASAAVRTVAETPFVGREWERRLLHDALTGAVERRACHLFTLLGPAGIGKSRLVDAFVGDVGARARILRGACRPSEGMTYRPLRDALFDALEGGATTPAHVLGDAPDARRLMAAAIELVGLAEPDASTRRDGFRGVRRIFEALATRRPLVLVFDDLQWAEPGFLELVEQVAEWSRGQPMLIVCLARPEFLERRPAWAGGKPNATTISVEPLDDATMAGLVPQLLGGDVEPEVVAAVVRGAGGNPLYLHEITVHAVERQLVRRVGNAWVASIAIDAFDSPASLGALMSSRIDELPRSERAALAAAAIEGERFTAAAIEYVTAGEIVPSTVDALESLVRRDLVRAHDDQRSFRFRHVLVRDAAYASVSPADRRRLHERFAAWVELSGDGRTTDDEILGYHLERAYVDGSDGARSSERGQLDRLAHAAGRALASAGRSAYVRGDARGAERLLSRAWHLLPADDATRLSLAPELADALAQRGRWEDAVDRLDGAVEAARRVGDRSVELRSHVVRLRVGLLHGRTSIADAQRELEALVPALERHGDQSVLAAALLTAAEGVYKELGRHVTMQRAAERAAACAAAVGDPMRHAFALMYVADAVAWGPTPAPEAIDAIESLLPGDDLAVPAAVLPHLARMYAATGRYDDARAAVDRAEAFRRELGWRSAAVNTRLIATIVEVAAGDVVAAEREARRAWEGLSALRDDRFAPVAADALAAVLLVADKDDEAEELIAFVERSTEAENVFRQVGWRSSKAELLARRGQLADAERTAVEAVRLSDRTDAPTLRAGARVALARVLDRGGRQVDATGVASEAARLFVSKQALPSQ
ncbi:MAG TPA: BTAD domain-containing putative transcriptional regulator, partial [Gaiellaceae bacterium]|nr:BTAD domain-containing putative transcriptional regulator [Gaiellaceae bacterium]